MAKFGVVAAAAVAGLLFIALVTSCDTSSTTSQGASATLPKGTAATTGYKLGQAFRLGDFSYRVDRVIRRSFVGNQFLSEAAGQGAALVLVFYTIRNEGSESETVMTDDFKLVDAKGRSFRTDSKATTVYMTSGGGGDFLLSELHPGIAKGTVQVFRLPTEALEATLALEVPEKGWGSGKIRVTLCAKACKWG